jgi:hypothetical protein
VVGVLTLDDSAPRTFSPEAVRLVVTAGAHIDAIIARAKADDEPSWHLRTLAAVRELLQEGATTTSVADTGQVLARVVAAAFDADHATFVRQEHGHITDLVAAGLDESSVADLRRSLLGSPLDAVGPWHASLIGNAPTFVSGSEDAWLPATLAEALGGHPYAVLPIGGSSASATGSSWASRRSCGGSTLGTAPSRRWTSSRSRRRPG